MLIEQRPGIQPIERPKLSPEGKPIVRVMDFTTSYFLRCDLFPNVITRHNSPPFNDFKEDFADLLLSRAQKHKSWLEKNTSNENKTKLEELNSLIEGHKKHANSHLSDGFKFVPEVGNPRELKRPYSQDVELLRGNKAIRIDERVILKFDEHWQGWGSFLIISDTCMRTLRDKQLDKGIWQNPFVPGEVSMLQMHLSPSRPRVFVGADYEIIYKSANSDNLALTINTVNPSAIEEGFPFIINPEVNFANYLKPLGPQFKLVVR